MIFEWQRTPQLSIEGTPEISRRTVERVLVEYDGPQWMILSDGEQRFLAYAADEDKRSVRWIEAPVSGVELRAVCTGRLPLRSAILKPSLVVVDYTYDRRLLGVMTVDPENIPADCLPDPGVLLPRFARDEVAAKAPTHAAFACDGPLVRANSIPFAAISALTSALQAMWTSLSASVGLSGDDADGWGPATLPFTASRSGSFVIEVEPPNAHTFAAIASEYKSLVTGCYGGLDDLEVQLDNYDPRVVHAYHRYLRALQTYRLDVMAEWADDAAFVGYEGACRVEGIVSRAIAPEETPREISFHATGFFDGWMSHGKRFEFFDVGTGQQYIGKVDARLMKRLERPPRLGRTGPMYTACIRLRSKKKADSATYRLLQLESLSDAGPLVLAPPSGRK